MGFLLHCQKKFSFVGREVKQNKLGKRTFYYVTYTKDVLIGAITMSTRVALCLLIWNVLMIQKQLMVHQISTCYVASMQTSNQKLIMQFEMKKINEATNTVYEIDRDENNLFYDSNILDDEFLDEFEKKDEVSQSESARYDFIRIQRTENIDLQEHILGVDSEEYMKEFLARTGKAKPPKGREAKRVALRKCLKASPAERLTVHRSLDQIKALYVRMCHQYPRVSDSIKSMMVEILGADWTQILEEEDEDSSVYYLQRSNLPCCCSNCLLRQSAAECQSRYKKYMHTSIVQMKQQSCNVTPHQDRITNAQEGTDGDEVNDIVHNEELDRESDGEKNMGFDGGGKDFNASDLSKMRVRELKEKLRAAGVSLKGARKKNELIDRLLQNQNIP